MNLKLITPVVTEPVTLVEAKMHLRLDTVDLENDHIVEQSIAPGSHAINTFIGISIDILGYGALVVFDAGTNGTGGKVDAHIEESDDNTTWADWTGGVFTQVTEANDNDTFSKEYTGGKRYIRVVAVVTVAACSFGISIAKISPYSAEDTLISSLITVAREYCEAFTRRALATQTWELILDDFPGCDYIEVPKCPLQSITSVKYRDSAGTQTTMTLTTEYLYNADTHPGVIVLPYGCTWPSFTPYPTGAVRIEFICGYSGVSPSIIPKSIKQAMLLMIGHLFEHREAINLGSENAIEMPLAVKALLWPYKIHSH